jgi:hypothetical protein
MIAHEIAGIAGLIVVGTILISAWSPGSTANQLLGTAFTGFGGTLQAMRGSGTAPQGG